jgi:hypothetical protein
MNKIINIFWKNLWIIIIICQKYIIYAWFNLSLVIFFYNDKKINLKFNKLLIICKKLFMGMEGTGRSRNGEERWGE